MGEEAHAIILPRTEDLVFWLFLLVAVIFLLLWDLRKAWKRRAFWIPGQALVLSALIIQLLSFIGYSHIRVYSGSRYQTKEVVVILVKNQLMIDRERLMLYVLIAYLLPGMARSGSISNARTLAVLALSITFQVVSQVRSGHWEVEKRNESLSALAASSEGFDRIISYLCSNILILAIIYLLWLLMRAIMVGRSIRRIMSQRIRSALSCCTPDHPPSCHKTKDHVLKCWIVVRLSQPDYVLARSGLCSMVCRIVTACIGLHVINWRHVQFTDNESLNSVTKRTLVQFVIVGQFVIVLIGWVVLFVRGVTSRMHGDISRGDDLVSMSIEDALTDLTAYFIRLFVRDKRIQEKKIREMNKKIRDIISLLWYPRHWVQKLFQIFSMQNPPRWLTSTKRWLSRIKTGVIESIPIAVPDNGQFSMYEETLKIVLFPGESAPSLWKANQWGFRKVERYMDQGHEDGKRSPRELICLLRLGTVTAEDVLQELVEDVLQANKNSWKRTAVSLIHFMIYFYDDHSDDSEYVIEDAMQCYIQGWEYMNLVDGLNEEVKSLGRQADKEFNSLQHTWNKDAQPVMLHREIKRPLSELIQQLESCSYEERCNLQNSWDSTEVAKHCLFETWKVIDPSIHWLLPKLANVYFFYMTEDLNKAVLQKCSKLAEEGMEEEILDVAFLAAKAQGALDKAGGGPTGQASTSSHSPTVGKGNDQVIRYPPLPPYFPAPPPPYPPRPRYFRAPPPPRIEVVGEGNDQAERPPIWPRPRPRPRPPNKDAGEDDSTDSDKEDDSTDPDKEKTL